MLSALTHHLNKLEEKIEEQTQELNAIKLRDNLCDCTKEICDLRKMVDHNQKHISDIQKKVNDLVKSQNTNKSEDKNKQYLNESRAPETAERITILRKSNSTAPNQASAPEHWTQNEFFNSLINSNYGTLDQNGSIAAQSCQNGDTTKHTTETFAQVAAVSNWRTETSENKAVVAWTNHNVLVKQPPAPIAGNQLSPAKDGVDDISLNNIRAIAAENSGLRNQIVMYRRKVHELSQAMCGLEEELRDLRHFRETYLQKEQDWNQRQEWLDHKMRLLKQDKRRRGETIGKLLKVIDDLKDMGRLDESKIKDGRAVLAVTLQTRDVMSPDERVSRVVDAIEYDRVPKYNYSGSTPSSNSPALTDNYSYGNENVNNSARVPVYSVAECPYTSDVTYANTHMYEEC